jgi:ubiquinone/menaquinone biosynthesis C-methylase UbiE
MSDNTPPHTPERLPRPPRSSTAEGDSSWQAGSHWYDSIVGDEGHYYHQHVVLPNLERLLKLPHQGPFRLADLACGQGILERLLPSWIEYWGVDLSSNLIELAQHRCEHPERAHWICADATRKTALPAESFDRVVVMLAMQNMEAPGGCLKEIHRLLKPDGVAIVVLNHPAFRVPTQSDWVTDRDKGVRGRRVDRYLSPMKIPLRLHPSQKEQSAVAWAFHLPLSTWSQLAEQAGLGIVRMEEWCSNKTSEGPLADIENRARKEIPLFLALVLRKWS